jgi:hypothetical protein
MTESFARLKDLQQAWRPAVRLAAYFAVLAAIYLLLTGLSPWFDQQLGHIPQLRPGASKSELVQLVSASEPASETGAIALLTMSSALLLALPIVWVYTFARQKKGFQQSLAQTLIILPVVVAVVVVLVGHSVALAFSLGGIVGAVAFRHRLEDTKDAVYIFVAIAIGVGVGVQAYSVAYVASVFYNFLALALWSMDFARAPAPLAGRIAQRRVELARGRVADHRTGDYVAELDQQLLQSMTPDQLKSLADLALKRKDNYLAEFHDVVDPREVTIRAVAAAPELLPGLRTAIEATLRRDAKRWSFEKESSLENGTIALWYRARFRKSIPADVLVDSIRRAAGPLSQDVKLE